MFDILKTIFESSEVKSEWTVSKNAKDDWDIKGYCPRLDFAIGPFNNTSQEADSVNDEINKKVSEHETLLKNLFQVSDFVKDANERIHVQSFQDFHRALDKRENPRCFVSIEVESSGGTKHSLGDLVNASILGKVGLVIPTNEKQYRLFVRMRRYFSFVVSVHKTKLDLDNTLIIRYDRFVQVLTNKDSIQI